MRSERLVHPSQQLPVPDMIGRSPELRRITWTWSSEHSRLGKSRPAIKLDIVRPEDRALLGSNPSAAVDSNTAGLGGTIRPGRPPEGSALKRKIPGVRGQSPRAVPGSNQDRNPGQKGVSFLGQPAFHAEPVRFQLAAIRSPGHTANNGRLQVPKLGKEFGDFP